MANEIDAKIETILISCVNRLYKLEETCGLSYEDLKCFEILTKIRKDYHPGENTSDPTKTLEVTAENVMALMRKAKGSTSNE